MMYTSKCSSRSVVPSYFSIIKFFRLKGKVASMILGAKGFLNCNNCLPKVLRDGGTVPRRTLELVALGKPIVVDSVSLPSSRLAPVTYELPIDGHSRTKRQRLFQHDAFAFSRPELVTSTLSKTSRSGPPYETLCSVDLPVALLLLYSF